jgi:hypothetical protein
MAAANPCLSPACGLLQAARGRLAGGLSCITPADSEPVLECRGIPWVGLAASGICRSYAADPPVFWPGDLRPGQRSGIQSGALTPAPVRLSQRANWVPIRASGQVPGCADEADDPLGTPGSCLAAAGLTPAPATGKGVRAKIAPLLVTNGTVQDLDVPCQVSAGLHCAHPSPFSLLPSPFSPRPPHSSDVPLGRSPKTLKFARRGRRLGGTPPVWWDTGTLNGGQGPIDPVLVGCDVELGILGALLDRAATGTYGALIVRGDAGVGKTVLIQQSCAAVD